MRLWHRWLHALVGCAALLSAAAHLIAVVALGVRAGADAPWLASRVLIGLVIVLPALAMIEAARRGRFLVSSATLLWLPCFVELKIFHATFPTIFAMASVACTLVQSLVHLSAVKSRALRWLGTLAVLSGCAIVLLWTTIELVDVAEP
jgi:hypothetical protein